MNGSWRDWPALEQSAAWPATLTCQRGIWGKFRGSREDFGWIGRSPRFDSGNLMIEQRLSLGSEDRLEISASFWKVVNDACFAIRIYPSPVVDRAGRRGLEKHFVECACGAMPPAAAAAAMLQVAARLSDAGQISAATPVEHTGGIALLDEETVEIGSALPEILEAGIAELERLPSGQSLVDAYESILAGARPAVLVSPAPLGPAAMAAFLLPLDRTFADRLSMAGWIVSSRFDPDALKASWQIVVHDSIPSGFAPMARTALRPLAETLAAALLTRDPGALRRSGRPQMATSSPPTVATPVQQLIEFARSPDRWRELRITARTAAGTEGREALRAALDAIREQQTALPRLEGLLLDARRRHLQSKADLIKNAALQMDPSLADLDWIIA